MDKKHPAGGFLILTKILLLRILSKAKCVNSKKSRHKSKYNADVPELTNFHPVG